jgi:tetratricopeptide (TPR) repeat protein
MKTFLISAVLLTFAGSALAQTGSPSQPTDQGAQTQTQQTGTPGQTQQKVIKDPVEYNNYISATNIQDPVQKAAALEQFVQQYPDSVVREEALEGAMAAYQQANNPAKAADVAARLLQINPNNVAALAVTVYAKRQAANQNPQQAAQILSQAAEMAKRGLAALQGRTKPTGMSQEDFEKREKVFRIIFNGAAGQAALAEKNYADAQKYLQASVDDNPNDINDVYPLALAYLTAKPETDDAQLKGLWYIARATDLAPTVAAIADFGKKSYMKFHGSEEGWDQLLQQAKSSPTPPPGFTITKYVPPSPAEVAAKMIQETPPEQMDFGQWIFVLTSGNQQAADTVWNTLQGKLLRFQGKVIQSGRETVGLAVTQDGIDANRAEVTVTMTKPLARAPQAGSDLQLQAIPESYTVNPFEMKMDKGEPIGASAGLAGPTKKAPPRRRRH